MYDVDVLRTDKRDAIRCPVNAREPNELNPAKHVARERLDGPNGLERWIGCRVGAAGIETRRVRASQAGRGQRRDAAPYADGVPVSDTSSRYWYFRIGRLPEDPQRVRQCEQCAPVLVTMLF